MTNGRVGRSQSVEQLTSSGKITVSWHHRVLKCRDAFRTEGSALASLFQTEDGPSRVLIVIDAGLDAAQPELGANVMHWMQQHPEAVTPSGPPLIVLGGEQAKQDHVVFDQVVQAVHQRRICRQSYILAIGGGAMLDAVGLAAATAHRGVRLVRLPSTTLSQADAGVSVKNGINAFGAKNLIGTFAPPWAVINDATLLPTLDDVFWRGGLSEAVKVGLLKDPDLLTMIEESTSDLNNRDLDAMERIVTATANLHVNHIVSGGDPFESSRARPLDFGHWSAHQLEQMTGTRLSHGDAVGIGLLIDLQYAALELGASSALVNRVADCLASLGFPTHSDAMTDEDRLLEGIERFREHLGGKLAITMVTQPGRSMEIDQMDAHAVRQALRLVRSRGRERSLRAG